MSKQNLPEKYDEKWLEENQVRPSSILNSSKVKLKFIEDYLFDPESRKDSVSKRSKSLSKQEYDSVNDIEHKLYDENKLLEVDCCGALINLGFKDGRDYKANLLAKRILDIDKEILDFGSGNGINTNYLSQLFPQSNFHCIDISEKRIEYAKKWIGVRDNINFQQMDGTNLTFNNNSFDVVFTCHVLEQMESVIEEALNEIIRVAKDRIILLEPVFENGDAAQKLYLVKYGYVVSLMSLLKKRNDIKIIETFKLGMQGSPLNQSTLIHLQKIK